MSRRIHSMRRISNQAPSMYKIKSRSQKNIIGILLSGRLTAELYQEIVPHLEKRIKEYGKIRLLVELNHWEGWDPLASIKDVAFIFKNSFKLERVAFVIKSKSDKQAILLDQPFRHWFRNHTRYFSGKEKEAAWKWVEEGVVTLEDTKSMSVGKKSKNKIRYGRKIRTLIVGGGFSGLSMGVLLQERGFKPTIVEARQSLDDHDVMLSLWPSGSGVVKSMGIYKQLKKISVPVHKRQIFDPFGELKFDYSFERIHNQHGDPLLVPYSEVKALMKSSLKLPYVNMGIAVTKLERVDNGIKVFFSDGTKVKFDLVVCCDGIHSKMRELMFGIVEPEYSGLVGWSFTINRSADCDSSVIKEYWDKDRFIQFYPWNDKLYAFAALKTDEVAKDQLQTNRMELLRDAFKHFSGIVPDALSSFHKSESIWHDNIYGLKQEDWVDFGVVLLGDAASTFLPTSALSPSLILESAYVLTDELARSDTQFLNAALQHYASRRLNRIAQIEQLLKREGFLGFVNHQALQGVTDFKTQFHTEDKLIAFWQDYLEGNIQ